MAASEPADSSPILGALTGRARRFLNRPELILSAVLTGLLAILVLVPLAEIIRETLTYQSYDQGLVPDAVEGEFTLLHVTRAFFSDISWALFYKPFIHSLIVAFSVTILAVGCGAWASWILVRTDVPCRRVLNSLVVVPYMMPSWVLALAWIAVFKNDRISGAEGIFESVFGLEPPNWIAYGMLPTIVCLTFHYYVYTYLLVSGALASVNDELEEAGAVGGVSRLRRFLIIMAPLLLPALGSAVVMTFIRVLGTFGTPALLGLPVRFYTLPTQIYSLLSSRNSGDGFVLALVLVALAITFIYINSRLIGVRKSFVTVSGKGFRRRTVKLGSMRWPVFAILAAGLFAIVALPLGLLLLESVMAHAGVYSIENITLHYWIGESSADFPTPDPGVLRHPEMLAAIWNSIRLGILAAFFTGILGLLIGYSVVRTRGTMVSKALEGIAFTPYIFPAVALGAIYLGMFSHPIGPIPALYGTFTLLVLVTTIKAMPFSSRTGISAMMQIDRSLEDAARVQGLNWVKRMWRIVMPLAASGMISGMLLAYITVMRELSLIILLVTPNNDLLTSVIFNYQLQDNTHHTGAATIVLVGLIVTVHLCVRMLSNRIELKAT